MRMRSLARLHWTTPFKALPHGVLGLITVVSGACIIACSLSGSLAAVINPWTLWLFAISAGGNALAGLAIVDRAPKDLRNIFRSCSIFQLCLIHCALRFSNSCPRGHQFVVVLDMAMSVLSVLCIASFVAAAVTKVPPAVGAGVVLGSVALALLVGYPLQLAVLGEVWWECVSREYPEQGPAMAAYIYVPAAWAFAVMLFGATLWNRKIIGDVALGGWFAGFVLATLVSTVLMQEVHFPEPASTQKLWLPCPAPAAGSWSAWAVVHLDTSMLARSVLARIR